MMLTALLLALACAELWRRRRAFKRRIRDVDRFMEWGEFEKIDY
jgi:hypothetical protein